MEQKEKTILFVIDVSEIINSNVNYDDIKYFYEKINNKREYEKADKITIVITDFKCNSTRDDLCEYGLQLKQILGHDINFYRYNYTQADKNTDFSNMTSYQMQCTNNRHKYNFILNIINKVSKKYNVVYTALMHDLNIFDTSEEFQAKEEIKAINNICKFDLLLNSNRVNNLQNTYNDHLVISSNNNLYGYAESLAVKMDFDNGIMPNETYREYNLKNKKQKKDMLIIIDAYNMGMYEDLYDDLYDDLLNNIISKKQEVGADDIYIVVSSRVPNYFTKDELKEIGREIRYILGDEAKYYVNEYASNDNHQSTLNSSNNLYLNHAIETKNSFSKKYKANFIYTAYFTNALSYNNINIFNKEKMNDSKIDFFAHSAEKDINGVVCSNVNGLDALNDCLIYSMNKDSYKDNDTSVNNKEITVFYCDIAGTIDYITHNKDMIKTLNDKLIELNQTHGTNKILLCLITNDSDLNYLNAFINELKNKMDSSIIFTDHFYVEGALINGKLVQEGGSVGYNKFGKIKYHLNKLINNGYKINYVYFADDNMDEYDVFSFDEYLPNETNGRLLIPDNNCNIIENYIISSEFQNIDGLIDCINKSIDLECSKEKGIAYKKQYIAKTTEVEDDDDDLPF